MIRNEDTYYVGYHKNVRELGALPAVAFDTIAGLLRENDSDGVIANSTLADLLGITEQGLRKIISKLIECDYIEKIGGNGRGNKTAYQLTEKGKQCSPFSAKKGETMFRKRGNNVSEKEKQSLPINKVLSKELKESGSVVRDAHPTPLSDTTPQSIETGMRGDTPHTPQTNENAMKEFDEFWELYPGDPDWTHEKNQCELAWNTLRQSYRDNLLQQLRRGKRWRVRDHDNPLWYIRNYNGEQPDLELPFVAQGTAKFGKWIYEVERAGAEACVMRYRDKIVYCLKQDKQTMIDAGAEYIRDHVPFRD